MLLGILTGPSIADVQRQIAIGKSHVDGFEWRLDSFSSDALEALGFLKEESRLPSLFTLRTDSQGGKWKRSHEVWRALIEHFLTFQPTYIDIEYAHPKKDWIETIIEKQPETKVILSLHDFHSTPDDLEEQWRQLCPIPAFGCKMAFQASSTLDMLRLMAFVKQTGGRLTGIPMGELGRPGRILGPIVGNYFDYVALETNPDLEKTGIFLLDELLNCYRYRSLGPFTTVYALLGDPVSASSSHITHNAWFEKKRWNRVYLKLALKKEELPDFFSYAQQLPIQGCSVTMPLKTAIAPFVDKGSTSISDAINTLLQQNGRWKGENTDGLAAVQLLERYHILAGKKCIILGAGGTAGSIAHAIAAKGGRIILINRTLEHAQKIALQVGGLAYPLEDLPVVLEKGYDILVHATSVGFNTVHSEALVEEKYLHPGSTLLEVIANPKKTLLVQRAENRGCKIIYGDELFHHQAALQFQLWK